jgi:hypothetical protein
LRALHLTIFEQPAHRLFFFDTLLKEVDRKRTCDPEEQVGSEEALRYPGRPIWKRPQAVGLRASVHLPETR